MKLNIPNNSGPQRDAAILERIHQGNFEITWTEVTSSIEGHTATFQVFADALKIEGVRFGAGAGLAQKIADTLGCSLLTPKLLELLYMQRAVTIPPFPMYDATKMMTTEWFEAHSAKIDAELVIKGYAGGIVQTTGKPWMISNDLLLHPGHSENYGWFCPPGTGVNYRGCTTYASVGIPNIRVLQQPGWAHGLDQADYSETVTLVSLACDVDGQATDLRTVLQDKELAPLASHQGVLRCLRQPGVPEPTDRAITLPEIAV